MSIQQDPTQTGWSGRPLLGDALVLSEEQIARAAHCSDPDESDEAAWDRYLRALAIEGIKSGILRRNAAIIIGPVLEPEAPGRLLAVNGIATQLLCCTDLAEVVEVDLTPWRQQATAPQILLAVQVEEDNGVVRVAGVIDGPSFVERIKHEGKTHSASIAEVPVTVFAGGFEQFQRWATVLPASALPRVAVLDGSSLEPRGLGTPLQELQAQIEEWVKRLLQEAPAPIPLEVMGTRASDRGKVCLINPWIETNSEGNQVALAVSSTPTIWADRPLAEILIERDGMPVWQQLATSKQPIEGAIAWPLEPLKPSESCILKLRPYGATGGAYSKAVLLAADSIIQKAADEVLTRWAGEEAPLDTQGMGRISDSSFAMQFEFAARHVAQHHKGGEKRE